MAMYEEGMYSKMSADNLFTGYIEKDGSIYVANIRGNQTKVGIDVQRESELLAHIDEITTVMTEYRDKLIELGVLKLPKTPEELAQEQANQQAMINTQLLEAIKVLKDEIKDLKGVNANGNDRLVNDGSRDADGNDSENDRAQAGGNQKRTRASQKGASANNE